ncbi:YczE/YyaS/YitT family protein [Mitsuokella sp.]
MSTPKRYILLIIAVMIQSAGIALVVKSLLGTSPISSVPYVLSLISPFTFGQTTFAVNMLFVVFELLMLKRNFPAVFWLQIPVTIVFGLCIDFFMALFTIVPEAYPLKIALCIVGTALVALGVAGQGVADVLMLAGEGAVYTFAHKFHIDFGKVKVGNDVSLVIIAAIVSMASLGTIEGIREGTLISALLTGVFARFFLRHLSRVDEHGRIYLALH